MKIKRNAKRGPLDAVAFAPNGNTLAAGGWDTSVLVWDIRELGGGVPGFSWHTGTPGQVALGR